MHNLYGNSFNDKNLQNYILSDEFLKYKDDFNIKIKKLYQNENIITIISKEKIEAHGVRSKSQIEKKNVTSIIIKNQNKTEEKYLKYDNDFYYENSKNKDSINKNNLKRFLSKKINFN